MPLLQLRRDVMITVKYRWVEYTSEYAMLVESWIDDTTRKFTGCDEGWEDYFNFWKNDPQTQMGVNFWGKVVFLNSVPIAVISLALSDQKLVISEFIVAPTHRRRGFGSEILQELLAHGDEILGFAISTARAVIFPNNIASQKAFEKANFTFQSAHPDGDAWYYNYQCETV